MHELSGVEAPPAAATRPGAVRSAGSGSGLAVTGHPRRWWILAVLCLVLSIIVIDNTILAVALPEIARDLDASESTLQWVTTAYGLVLASLLLPVAGLGDRYGRKGSLLVGLCVFGMASAVAAWAATSGQLVAARAALGFGGACAMPATLAILSNVFPDDERGRAIGLWSAVAGLAGAVGPVAGGLLLRHFWWGSVFLVNVPIVAVAIAATVWLVPPSRDPASRPIDLGGSVLWTASLGLLLFGIIEGPERGWTSPSVILPLSSCVAAACTFAWWERRSADPLLPGWVVRDHRLQAGVITVPAVFFAVFGTQFVLTQWLQGAHGFEPLEAGLCFVPNAIAVVIASASSPRVASRFGETASIAAGFGLIAAGLAVAAVATSADDTAVLVAALTFVGFGVGLSAPIGVELQMGAVPPERAGIAAGTNETIVEAGGAFGVAVMGSVLAAGLASTSTFGAEQATRSSAESAAAAADFTGAVPAPLLVAAGVSVVAAIAVRWRLRADVRAG